MYQSNPNYQLQIGMYDVYKMKRANIVMLGNSITHGVNWNELLNRGDVAGRGVPSDILEGFISRLKYVIPLKPKLCFIMGGINDIYSGISLTDIFNSYTDLIKKLKSNGITPIIQSTLYVSSRWHLAEQNNQLVKKLNDLLKKYAKENKIDFIDLNSQMSSNMQLRDEFTYDGVHLTGKAYKIWGEEVEKIIRKYGM